MSNFVKREKPVVLYFLIEIASGFKGLKFLVLVNISWPSRFVSAKLSLAFFLTYNVTVLAANFDSRSIVAVGR